MIVKNKIAKTLADLDVLYNKSLSSTNPNDAIFFSKLAILEYCGWIEHSFDVITNRCIQGKLKTQTYKDIQKGLIENNHGFEYKKHYRAMLIKTIGIVNMEKFDTKLDSEGYLPILISELDNAKSQRDAAAHTYSANATVPYSAPSVTIQSLNKIAPIMKYMYSYACKNIYK